MKKRLCLLLAFLLAISIPFSTKAFGKEKHDDYLEQVLFGEEGYSTGDSNAIEAMAILKAGCAVAVDQYNGSYSKELGDLKKYGVRHLPSSIDEINYTDGPEHRGKTHLGWDHKYPTTGKYVQANWPVRKKILQSTVNKVFDFGFFSGWFGVYDEKCNSFSALIYYTHILADTIADKDHKGEHTKKDLDDQIIPLIVTQNSSINPDIISELQKHIGILFKDQDHSTLDKELDRLRYNAKNAVLSSYGEYNDSYYRHAEELMDILIKNIPDLLQNESFFNKVFPQN